MNLVIKKINYLIISASLMLINFCYSSALYAGSGWFPTMPNSEDMSSKGAMTVLSNVVKQGLTILLLIVAVVTFIKFITTVSHGIEEAKKHEGGSLAVFGTFAVMAIIYLVISLATGYLGYTVIDKFKL